MPFHCGSSATSGGSNEGQGQGQRQGRTSRDKLTGICSEDKKHVRVFSFDGSSYLTETLNTLIAKDLTDPDMKSGKVWKYLNFAMSDTKGLARFTKQAKNNNAGFEGGKISDVMAGSSSSSRSESAKDDKSSKGSQSTEVVGMTTIDSFFSELALSTGETLLKGNGIHVLKIDAEGNDNKVIRGATEAILHSVGLLTFEGGGGVTFSKEMIDEMDQMGYSCYSTSRAGLFKWNGGCMYEKYMGKFSAKDKGNLFCASRVRAPMMAMAFDALSFPMLILQRAEEMEEEEAATLAGNKQQLGGGGVGGARGGKEGGGKDEVTQFYTRSEGLGSGAGAGGGANAAAETLRQSVDASLLSQAYINIKPYCSPFPACVLKNVV